jgi:DNA-binding transcriptional ArsR family regulator
MSRTRTGQQAHCDPQAAAELLRALAHPMRLQIVCRLLDGELSVSGFEGELGLKQPSLSQQLGQLREADLVATRREAKSVFYSLVDDRVRILLDALRETLDVSPDRPAPAPRYQRAARPKPAAAEAAPRPRKPETAECGVFSVAGWAVAPSGKESPA